MEVDLNALKNNLKIIRQQTNRQILAVVKANGYGHGFLPITRASEEVGVSWFGVARPRKSIIMQEEGIQANILVMGYLAPERFEEMICLNVSLSIWTKEHIQQAISAAKNCQIPARVHLLADTGMGRLGCLPEETIELAKMAASEWINLEGFFSHLAIADEKDPGQTRQQEKIFNQLIDELKQNDLLPEIIHLANSADSLAHPSTHFNLIRPGIIIYGLPPNQMSNYQKVLNRC